MIAYRATLDVPRELASVRCEAAARRAPPPRHPARQPGADLLLAGGAGAALVPRPHHRPTRWPVTTASPGPPPTATSTRSSTCWQRRPRTCAEALERARAEGLLARDPGRQDHPRRPVPGADHQRERRGHRPVVLRQGPRATAATSRRVTAPDGLPLWVSDAEPGSVHDITAARVHALPALYRAAATRPARPRRPRLRRRRNRHPHPRQAARRRPGTRHRYPHPQRHPAFPALPAANAGSPCSPSRWRTLQHITASPSQDRRHRPRRPRPHPFRARLHHMKIR